MSQTKYWVWLSGMTELSVKTKCRLLDRFPEPEELYFASTDKIKAACRLTEREERLFEERSLDRANEILGKCDELNIQVITMQDSDYPRRLMNIACPPPVLYVKGRMPVVDDEAAIAVIGTRNASLYGLRCADKLGREIVLSGGVIVSGLTRGIEAEAVKGAVKAGGRVIAVLGTPHERDDGYLGEMVLFGGAIISEYAPGTVSMRSFFRDRNRISAGLSVGTVVVEAPEKSGTHGFVEEAIDQGKDIFAVPGGIDDPNSVGTNRMIRDGATLIHNGWDVMSEYERLFPLKVHKPEKQADFCAVDMPERELKVAEAPLPEKKTVDKPAKAEYIDLRDQLKELDEVQLSIISAIGKNAEHVDDIVEATGLSTGKVLAQLTVLEIKGYIRRENGKRFVLNAVRK